MAAFSMLAGMMRGGLARLGLGGGVAVVSLPFSQTMMHAQNTCMSLLIATLAVIAWRRALGVCGGNARGRFSLQTATGALIFSAWSSASAGAICRRDVERLGMVAINIQFPGTLSDYARRLGPNVSYLMSSRPYIWARHVTFRAFWQILLNGKHPSSSSALSITLSVACAGLLGMWLLVFAWRMGVRIRRID